MKNLLEAYIKSDKKRFLFGAGQQAVNCLYLLNCVRVKISGIIVSHKSLEALQNIPIYQADQEEEAKKGVILLAIGEKKQPVVKRFLIELGYKDIVQIDNWEEANFELKKLFFIETMKKYNINSEKEWIKIGDLSLRNPLMEKKQYSLLLYGTELTDIILPEAFGDCTFLSGGLYGIPECEISEEDVVWDIGAGIGCFSLAAERKCRYVCAVEASSIAYAYLKNHTLSHNRISCFHYVAGNSNKTVPFYERIDYCKYSTTEYRSGDQFSVINKKQIKIDSLSELIAKPVNFLKISTTGGEERVLLGALKVIQKYHPKIVVALEHVSDVNVLKSIIMNMDLGYEIFCVKNRLYAV